MIERALGGPERDECVLCSDVLSYSAVCIPVMARIEDCSLPVYPPAVLLSFVMGRKLYGFCCQVTTCIDPERLTM